METKSRSLAKAISYRALGSFSTAALVFLFTGSWKMSVSAAALDSIIKICLYFLHERLWNHIYYGRPRAPEYEI